MPFRVIRNDITKVEADAIVNTANPEPVIGGGTDYAIHTAAGQELLEARRRIGSIAVGCCAATPAFRLPARYVLHTVSPSWVDGRHGEEALLRHSYDAALTLAGRLGCRSAAFPLMAAGTYGFPQEVALAVAIQAFTDYLMDHEMQIDLVLFNARAFGLAGSLFDDLKSYIDENYVRERTEEEYRIDTLPYANSAAPMAQRPREKRRFARRREADREETVGASIPLEAPEAMPFDASLPMPPGAPEEVPHTANDAASSLDDFLRQHEKTFSEYLLDLLREREGKDSEVYKRAEVSKQLFSKILNNRNYQPSKSTVLQLAIGLQLDLPQTRKLLEKAGYALTRSSKTDLVVQYYIERKIYSVTFINEALYDCGLPLLKTGLKA